MNDILHAGTDKKADGKNTAFFLSIKRDIFIFVQNPA